MILDGALGTEAVDSSAEVLDIEGADISDWENGTLLCNWEHEAGEKGASTIVGKVIYAKKIFSESDCEDDRQRMYWGKIGCSFIYGVVRLFDTAGHREAQNIAAIVRDCAANDEPIVVRFSVEGSTLERDGNRLKHTMIRRVAITVRPCNRTAVSGLVLDEQAPDGFRKDPLDGKEGSILSRTKDAEKGEAQSPFSLLQKGDGVEVGVWDRADAARALLRMRIRRALLRKATEAGVSSAAPSALVGGAALQREDPDLRRRQIVAVCKAAVRDYRPELHGDSFKAFLKHQLPNVSDEFLDHFADSVDDVRVRLRKADLTVLGEPVKPPKDAKRGQVSFDEDKGELTTPKGRFKLYNPDKDDSLGPGVAGEKFRQIWHSPEVRKVHDYATRQWLRLHDAMKNGRLPEAVVASAAAFSMLSPNTPVGPHELQYAYLLDTIKEKGYDLRDPRFAHQSTYDNWIARDRPYGTPKSSFDYFFFDIEPLITNQADAPDTGRLEGERTSFMLPVNKFANMARYHVNRKVFENVVRRHGVDGRSAVEELMRDKHVAILSRAKRERAIETGKSPPVEEGFDMQGLAPKTSRFAYAMLGAGNVIVPDTHMVRHLMGLNKSVDSATIAHLKDAVFWNKAAQPVVSKIDKWYAQNHPAVRYMLEHPEFGHHFRSDPEQAIFGAFWAHWLSISQHEAALGHSKAAVASNEQAYHRPYFDEVERLMSDPVESAKTIPAPGLFTRVVRKSESIPGGPLINPVTAAYMMRDWQQQLGSTGALHAYYTHLVPLLYPEGEIHQDVSFGGTSKLMRAESLSVEVLRAVELVKGARDESDQLDSDSSGEASTGKEGAGNPQTSVFRRIAPASTRVVDSQRHGVDHLNTTPEQRELIHGLDMDERADLDDDRLSHVMWDTSEAPDWLHHPDGSLLITKGMVSSYPRELWYHNLARDFFGFGSFLPLTAAVRHPRTGDVYMVQRMVPGAEHVVDVDSADYNQIVTHKRLAQDGTLDKLGIMNLVLMNGDRHSGNYLMSSEDPGLKLIDHGNAFAGSAHHYRNELPAYMKTMRNIHNHAAGLYRAPDEEEYETRDPAVRDPRRWENQPTHPDAVRWALSLDKTALDNHMQSMLIDRSTRAMSLGALEQIQRILRSPKASRRFLHENVHLRYQPDELEQTISDLEAGADPSMDDIIERENRRLGSKGWRQSAYSF